jgi:hypothetical protein
MKDARKQIDNLPWLSVEERAALEAFVLANPSLKPALDQAIANAMTGRINVLSDPHPRDEDIAFFIALRDYSRSHPLPHGLRPAHERFAGRLAGDAELRRRTDEIEAKMRSVSGAVDPVAHFERLTGRRLSAPQAHRGRAEDRGPKPARPRPKWPFVTAATLVVAYVAVFAAGQLGRSDLDRLAAVDPGEVAYYRFATRGESVPELPAEQQLVGAIETLAAARTSTLGLFPRFDSDRARAALSVLERLVATETEDDALRSDAYFYLGRARLMLDDHAGAETALSFAIEHEGRRATEAAALLALVRRTAP